MGCVVSHRRGIVFQRKDLLPFADYIVDRQFYRPVDILAYYWFARESSQRQEAAIAHFGAVNLTNISGVWAAVSR